MLLKEEINKYLNYCKFQKELNDKTIKAYKADLEQFITVIGENNPDKETLNSYLLYLHRMYKQKTVKRKIASVKALFHYLEEEEIIEINPLYWLKTISNKREILVLVDGNRQRMIFSDSGPGIKEDDIPYVFEAFYSGKGEEGRGLGLYIAKQLLDKYDYTIDMAEFSKDKLLTGANFVLEFIREVQ